MPPSNPGSVSAAERVRARLQEAKKDTCALGHEVNHLDLTHALEIALEALEPHQKQWAIVAIERMADALEGRDG